MTALVTLEELTPRLPFTLSSEEEREANGALEDLSFDALAIGNATWTEATLPLAVKNLILRAAARHMKNYEGYTVSRAGDETVQWAEQDAPGQATFSEDEKTMLRQMGGKTPFIGGVGQYAWGTKYVPGPVGRVPADGKPFPLFADDVEPW
jgi:hypothetical protein